MSSFIVGQFTIEVPFENVYQNDHPAKDMNGLEVRYMFSCFLRRHICMLIFITL